MAAKLIDPEEHRMTIGEHLEELRKRLFLSVIGFVLAFIVFMILGEKVVDAVCRPLQIALARNGLPATIVYTDPSEVFMTYIKAAMISALAFAGPWMLYQLWLFVAAGLYAHERRYITKYLPLSLVLFVIGVTFLYFYVLPLMLEFFMKFSVGDLPNLGYLYDVQPNGAPPVVLPIVAADPPTPVPGSIWINSTKGLIKICLSPNHIRVIPFGSASSTTPMITLGTYFEMVVGMLLAFGVAFQLPLVVLSLVRIGILDVATLKKLRKVVVFILSIVSAVIVPDVVTGMIALLLPLILLYEFGILLASWKGKPPEDQTPAGP